MKREKIRFLHNGAFVQVYVRFLDVCGCILGNHINQLNVRTNQMGDLPRTLAEGKYTTSYWLGVSLLKYTTLMTTLISTSFLEAKTILRERLTIHFITRASTFLEASSYKTHGKNARHFLHVRWPGMAKCVQRCGQRCMPEALRLPQKYGHLGWGWSNLEHAAACCLPLWWAESFPRHLLSHILLKYGREYLP